jgi:lysozyme
MKTNDFGINLIKQFEGLVDGDPKTPGLDPYICPAGYVTIGYGHTLRDTNGAMLRGREGISRAKVIHKPITPEEAHAMLADDLLFFEAETVRLTKGVELNENQFSAVVSFIFNLGPTKFERSTLRKLLLAGNFDKAAEEFPKWVKGDTNGDGVLEDLPGLIRRREAERQLFLKPVKPLSQSRTIWAGASAAAATGAATVADIAGQMQIAQDALAPTGTHLDFLKYGLSALAVLGALFTVYVRVDDRIRKGH